MTENNTNLVRREPNGRWLKGSVPNPGGKPKKDIDIEALATSHSIEAFSKLIELLSCKDLRVQLAAANSILDRAFGKAHQRVAATVTTLDAGKLWLDAIKAINEREAKTVDVEATPTHLVKGMATPISADTPTLAPCEAKPAVGADTVGTCGNEDGGTVAANPTTREW